MARARIHRMPMLVALALLALAWSLLSAQSGADPGFFQTSDVCMSCHNGLSTRAGEDISFGHAWRASMMANAARDPYWQAAVRRELIDFPASTAAVENECSRCHMPMASVVERQQAGAGRMFEHLPIAQARSPLATLAADGVSCTVCHQIEASNFGKPESFTGGFLIDLQRPWERRPVFGPYAIDSGRVTVMHSASAFVPTEARHVQQSELCATCHVLYTHAQSRGGEGVHFPEQTPYLEWLASDFVRERSCQSCHMPVVADSTPIASVLGPARAHVSRHTFTGGNFFMIRMLNRYRDELGVTALPQEMEAAALRTEAHLQTETARIAVERVQLMNGCVEAVVRVENLAGHKLPTAYPSRRAWIEFTVRDATGRAIFASGRLQSDGSIEGNDNDADARRYEPHHARITAADDVQIYESIMGDPGGSVTTGLLTAVRYLKDNRILPRGYQRATAHPDIAVQGEAATDRDFAGGTDRVEYVVDIGAARRPFLVEATLWYQPIGFRWARNLEPYDAFETTRFVRYYRSMASATAIALGRATARLE